MSTPSRSPPFRPNTPPSRGSRTPAARTGSTSCGGSSPRRRAHLTPEGALICEVGRGRERLKRDYPDLPFVWLDTEESEGEVFLLRGVGFRPGRNAGPSGRDERTAQAQAARPLARRLKRTSARNSSIDVRSPVAFDVPEGPAVAGGEPLSQRADLVDRADRRPERERAVRAHQRACCGAWRR